MGTQDEQKQNKNTTQYFLRTNIRKQVPKGQSKMDTLYLFAYIGPQEILCCVFVLFLFVLCSHVTSLSRVSIFDCPFGTCLRILVLSKYCVMFLFRTKTKQKHNTIFAEHQYTRTSTEGAIKNGHTS
jgi:hypothetical protein